MQTVTVLCLALLVAVVSARPGGEGSYTDKYDTVNLEEIISNKRLLVPYLKCVLEEGRCTPDGKELKSHIREALENNCKLCTPVQRSGTRRVLGHLINKEKPYWNQLKSKYDPQNKFVNQYETELRTIAASA